MTFSVASSLQSLVAPVISSCSWVGCFIVSQGTWCKQLYNKHQSQFRYKWKELNQISDASQVAFEMCLCVHALLLRVCGRGGGRLPGGRLSGISKKDREAGLGWGAHSPQGGFKIPRSCWLGEGMLKIPTVILLIVVRMLIRKYPLYQHGSLSGPVDLS